MIYPCSVVVVSHKKHLSYLKIEFMEYRRSFSMSRSERILLSSESVTSECAKIAGYERLSQSMKFDEEDEQKKNKKGIGFLSKVLITLTKTSTTHERNEVVEKEKKEKKRSSWLPDPDKRWPIQGWWLLLIKLLSKFVFDFVNLLCLRCEYSSWIERWF